MGVLVRKRGDAWWVFVNHRGQRKASRVGDKDSADKIAKKVRVRLASGTLRLDPQTGPVFKEYAEAWLRQHPQIAGVKEGTVEEYEKAVRCYLIPAFGKKPLTEITRADVKVLVTRLRENGSIRFQGRGLSPATVRQLLAPLALIFGEAVDTGLLQANPAHRIGRLSRKRTEQEAEGCDPFTREELEAIAVAAREHVQLLWPLVGVWVQSGMREGEVFGLQPRDLDLEAGTVIVRRTMSRGRLGSPKAGKTRVVNLNHDLLGPPDAVLDALRALLSVREAEAAVQGRDLDPGAFLFTQPNGSPLTSGAFFPHWRRCLKLAGVRYRAPEQLRHTLASTLLSRGVSLLYVQRQGGWADATTLLKHYSRWLPQEAPEVATGRDPRATSPLTSGFHS